MNREDNRALGQIDPKQYLKIQPFLNRGKSLNFTILDFWQWSSSNLLENTIRGVLAEFIVASALDVKTPVRVEWDDRDVEFEGFKIEVKSAAYVQAWEQEKLSDIKFSIQPKYLDTTRLKAGCPNIAQRRADLYVFCVFCETDFDRIEPLDVSQWEFYVLDTATLDREVGSQKSIGLNSLKRLDPTIVEYDRLKPTVQEIVRSIDRNPH